jgi:hypothetical protein
VLYKDCTNRHLPQLCYDGKLFVLQLHSG